MTVSRELTERQRTFVVEYSTHGNAAEAARAAGYSELVARQTAHKLLVKPHIAAEVRRQAVALIDAHIPNAVATLAELMNNAAVAPRDRIKAAEVLLRCTRPAGSAVAMQVDVGMRSAEAQSLIAEIWASRPLNQTSGLLPPPEPSSLA